MSHFRTSFDEYTVGERVEFLTATNQLVVGTVTAIGGNHATIALDDGAVVHCRPYQCRTAAPARVGQLDLFGATR